MTNPPLISYEEAVRRLYSLERPDPNELNVKSLGRVIADRGSTRRYAREAIDFASFSALLNHSTRGIPADFLAGEWGSFLDIYVVVNAVEGLPSGAYYFSPAQQGLEILREGDLREEAGHLCFEQAPGADRFTGTSRGAARRPVRAEPQRGPHRLRPHRFTRLERLRSALRLDG